KPASLSERLGARGARPQLRAPRVFCCVMRLRTWRPLAPLGALALCACLAGGAPAATGSVPAAPRSGIHKIQHVVVIMQENRSFDSYFGTFPGVDGIPFSGGHPSVCAPDPQLQRCVAPNHDTSDVDHGGPHGEA